MDHPKWWEFWKADPEPYTAHQQIREKDDKELIISEPVRSIVKAMISDRKRFIFQIDAGWELYSATRYSVLDIDTEEEFFVRSTYYPGIYTSGRQYYGPSWAKDYEIEWAINTVSDYYCKLNDRARSITTHRERNRLIEIYA